MESVPIPPPLFDWDIDTVIPQTVHLPRGLFFLYKIGVVRSTLR